MSRIVENTFHNPTSCQILNFQSIHSILLLLIFLTCRDWLQSQDVAIYPTKSVQKHCWQLYYPSLVNFSLYITRKVSRSSLFKFIHRPIYCRAFFPSRMLLLISSFLSFYAIWLQEKEIKGIICSLGHFLCASFFLTCIFPTLFSFLDVNIYVHLSCLSLPTKRKWEVDNM